MKSKSARSVLRCTLVDGTIEQDIEVTFSPESSVDSLLTSLPVDLSGRPVFVGADPLTPDGSIGASPLTYGSFLTVGGPGRGRETIPDDAVGVLRVLAGEDHGVWCWVRAHGETVVGRSSDCDLRLNTPDISRRHAAVAVSGGSTDGIGATVTDLGSRNGTLVAQTEIEGATELPSGGVFQVCDSVIQWSPLDRADRGWRRTDDGRIEIHRRSHVVTPPQPTTVDLPKPVPEQASNTATLFMGAVTPLVMALGMFVMTKSPASLLMAVFSPLMMGLQRHLETRKRKKLIANYAEEKAQAAAQIVKAVTAEERARRANDPDELHLRLYALGGLPGLWTKQQTFPDSLAFRVGTCDRSAGVELRGDRWKGLDDPKQRAVPVTVDLRQIGVLGVVGDRDDTMGLLRWIVLQLATRRSPEDFELYVVSSDRGAGLEWARWLPHLDVGDEEDVPCRLAVTDDGRTHLLKSLANLVTTRDKDRQSAGGDLRVDTDTVVVIDGARDLRRNTHLRTILQKGSEVGVYCVCVDEVDINECRGNVRLNGHGRVEITRANAEAAETVDAESMSAEAAEGMSRLLAPLKDAARAAGSGEDIPFPVRFLDLVDIDTPTPEDVERLWSANPGPTTYVPLGLDANSTVYVDLARHGPHTMMAGATGAGKSYLLQALVSSLLLHNRPDELNLVLVDFKGGAAFLPFTQFPGATDAERAHRAAAAGREMRCPQVVSLILSTEGDAASDFDAAAAKRVIASLKAEVSRREGILNRYGGELDRYLQEKPADAPPLPRLVLVFDEFARVLDTAPDFMPQLVNVAGKGRSLGMHLLLATQSLTGKLGPELKNNIELRISLRQNEKQDSQEVLEAPDAAFLPGRLKGRGYILAKKEEPPLPRPFQAGHLGAPPPVSETPPARVRIVEWLALGDPRPSLDEVQEGTPDLELTAAAIEAAATRLGQPRPFRPLLPPLPGRLTLADLPNLATETAPGDAIPYGLADHPERQAQPAQVLRLDGSVRLMIGGGPQSGRTTVLRALLHSAASLFAPDDLHVYVIEKEPSGLAAYEPLPHVGAVMGPGEPERIRAFVQWLGEEVQRRNAARLMGGEPSAQLLVLIDGWELFFDPTDPMSQETSLDRTLKDVIKAGPREGVHVVTTCDKAIFSGKVSELFSDRLVLPFPKLEDTKNALPSQGPIPSAEIKGRAALSGSGVLVQVADPGETAAGLVDRISGTAEARPPRTFPRLPRLVSLDRAGVEIAATPAWIQLGLAGRDASPFGIDLFAESSSLIVSGESGSGRSTAAALIAAQLAERGVGVVAACTPKSPLQAQLATTRGVSVLVGPTIADGALRAAAEALGTARTAIVVDDCDLMSVIAEADPMSFGDKPTLLAEALEPAAAGRLAVVFCGRVAAMLESSRPLTREVMKVLDSAVRVIIGPSTWMGARNLGFDLEPDQLRVVGPGRGHAKTLGAPFVVQLASAPRPLTESRGAASAGPGPGTRVVPEPSSGRRTGQLAAE